MPEYLFDVELMSTVRLTADSVEDARKTLRAEIDAYESNLAITSTMRITELSVLNPNVVSVLSPVEVDGEMFDETYDSSGEPLPRGRCDTCGAPCEASAGYCTRNPRHQVAVDGGGA